MEDIIKYLDQLTWEYTQLCLRGNGTVYGIASGKQCRQGKPISENPNRRRENKSEARPSQSGSIETSAGLRPLGSRSIFEDKQPVKRPPSPRLDGQIGWGGTPQELLDRLREERFLKLRDGGKIPDFLNNKKDKKGLLASSLSDEDRKNPKGRREEAQRELDKLKKQGKWRSEEAKKLKDKIKELDSYVTADIRKKGKDELEKDLNRLKEEGKGRSKEAKEIRERLKYLDFLVRKSEGRLTKDEEMMEELGRQLEARLEKSLRKFRWNSENFKPPTGKSPLNDSDSKGKELVDNYLDRYKKIVAESVRDRGISGTWKSEVFGGKNGERLKRDLARELKNLEKSFQDQNGSRNLTPEQQLSLKVLRTQLEVNSGKYGFGSNIFVDYDPVSGEVSVVEKTFLFQGKVGPDGRLPKAPVTYNVLETL